MGILKLEEKMENDDKNGMLSAYEAGFDDIEDVLDDESLSARDKLEAIEDLVYGDDDQDSEDAQ